MNLYTRMGKELRSLFKDLFDPKHADATQQKMAKILATAIQIGGPLQKEAQQLNAEIAKFLKNPGDPKILTVMKQHALQLEQETREI